jgi:hypothetical protein
MRNQSIEVNEEILNSIGIDFIDENYQEKYDSTYYAMYWPDGTIRWVFTVAGITPGFLAFYSAGNVRAKLGVCFMRMIAATGLMKYFAKKMPRFRVLEQGVLATSLKQANCNGWSLFAGTPGIDRKAVLALSDNGKIKNYVKVPISDTSRNLVLDEFKAIKLFYNLQLKSVSIPSAKLLEGSLILSNVNVENSRVSSKLGCIHLNGLKEIFQSSKEEITVNSYLERHSLIERFKFLIGKEALDKRIDDEKIKLITNNALRELHKLTANFGSKSIHISLAHRDFTPWNSLITKNSLIIFDLELVKQGLSFGFDIFHFTFQTSIMQGKGSGVNVYDEDLINALKELSQNITYEEFEIYKKLYFLYHISEYLLKYLEQPIVHEQVITQIDFWSTL